MIPEKDLLDWATRIGVQAKFDGLNKTQIENLISSIDIVEGDESSLLVVPAYAYRQSNRLRKGRNTATLIKEAFTWLYDNGGTKDDARKLLGLAKWIFEGVEKTRIPRVDVKKLTLAHLIKSI